MQCNVKVAPRRTSSRSELLLANFVLRIGRNCHFPVAGKIMISQLDLATRVNKKDSNNLEIRLLFQIEIVPYFY